MTVNRKKVCSYGDGYPVKGLGLCSTHYSRHVNGSDMDAPVAARAGTDMANMGKFDRKKSPVSLATAAHQLAVVGHPKRTEAPIKHVDGTVEHPRCGDVLAEAVRAETLVWDNEKTGCEATHRRAWRYLSRLDHDGYSVILEDDVAPVRDFGTQLRKVLASATTPVVSLYLGRGRPPHWQGAIAHAITSLPSPDVCWMIGTELLSAVGYAIRTDLLASLILGTTDDGMPIDEQVSEWARANGHQVGYCWPSIVEHRDLPPVIRTRADGQPRIERRVAWQVGQRQSWTSRAIELRSPADLGIRVVTQK